MTAETTRAMDLTEPQFWQLIDAGRSPHLWQRDGNEWKLRRAVWMEEA